MLVLKKHRTLLLLLLLFITLGGVAVWAQSGLPQLDLPKITIEDGGGDDRAKMSTYLQVMFFLTLLTLAPYILVMTTAFIRVTITLSFLRTALGTQQAPPTQVLMGLALFVTMYIMAPVGMRMQEQAIAPYLNGDIEQSEFFEKVLEPPRQFMLAQTRDKDIQLFLELGNLDSTTMNRDDAPIQALLPAFVLSEIKTAFQIGFLIYLPFLVIDMIVASVLMSMGMFMLSPMTISLPFKLLLFVMIDGWHLVINGVVQSFNGLPPSTG